MLSSDSRFRKFKTDTEKYDHETHRRNNYVESHRKRYSFPKGTSHQNSWLATCLLAAVLLNSFIRPWRWRRHVPPKRRLTLNWLHGVISQKIVLFTGYPDWWLVSVEPRYINCSCHEETKMFLEIGVQIFLHAPAIYTHTSTHESNIRPSHPVSSRRWVIKR
jgi:hypothetical protein